MVFYNPKNVRFPKEIMEKFDVLWDSEKGVFSIQRKAKRPGYYQLGTGVWMPNGPKKKEQTYQEKYEVEDIL